jgi:hypothetical protein
MAVSNREGGTSEFLKSNEVFQLFLVISNEVNTPTILACPMDAVRKRTTDFAFFSNSNLSYFVGLDADECVPQSILSGDRNISTNGRLMSGVLTLTTNPPVKWTRDLHHQTGNVGLGDGSAQQVPDPALMRQITSVTNRSARVAIP